MKTYNKFDVLYPSLNETTWQVPIAMALVMQVRDGKPFIVIG